MKRFAVLIFLAWQCASAQTYGRMDFSLQSAQGQAIAGAVITVQTQSGCGQAVTGIATLYPTANGGTPISPLTTDGFGHAFAYTSPGCVTITYSSPFTGTQTYADQTVTTPAGIYCQLTGCSIIDLGGQVFNVKGYGVKGNGIFSDFKMSAASHTVQIVDVCCGFDFTNAKPGMLISLPMVDSDHKTLYTTISSVTDSTHVQVAAASTFAFNGTGTFVNQAMWMTDDYAAINTAIAAAQVLPPGQSTRAGGGTVYFPCGAYGVSQTIRYPAAGNAIFAGENRDCVQIFYMGTTATDATIEQAATGTNTLRQGVYLNPSTNNHPELGSQCTGAACSPALTGGGGGYIHDLTIFGNKYADWAFAGVPEAQFTFSDVRLYTGLYGCLYHLNDTQSEYNRTICATDSTFGNGAPVNGYYSDGSALGSGPIPFAMHSPWVTNCTGSGFIFNFTGGGEIDDAQVSLCAHSLNIYNTSGGLTFKGGLYEGATVSDIVAGNSNKFIDGSITGLALTVSGSSNSFDTITLTGSIANSGANNDYPSFVTNGVNTFTDTGIGTNIENFTAYNQSQGQANIPENQTSTYALGGGDPAVRLHGAWKFSTSAQNITTGQYASGEAWKAIFIGSWATGAANNNGPANYIERNETSNTVTVGSDTLTFAINGSGYWQATASTTGMEFIGTIIFVPMKGKTAGNSGATSLDVEGNVLIKGNMPTQSNSTPVVNSLACIKTVGPPVIVGYCSAYTSGTTCTCN